MFFKLRKSGSFKNWAPKGSLRNQKWFFYGIAAKSHFWNRYFLMFPLHKTLLKCCSHQIKIVILGTVHLKVLWGTKNGSSKASLRKPAFGTVIFKSGECVHCIKGSLDYWNVLQTKKKWFFQELSTERFFEEPKMVLLLLQKATFGTFIFHSVERFHCIKHY